MSWRQDKRGGAPVGFVTELDGIEAATVVYLRPWCEGPHAQAQISSDFTTALGQQAVQSFEELCNLCARHGRRPLMRHSVHCKCLGADESCFANFVAAASEGAREDAMLMATLLVRPDMAPHIASLATTFGLALKRMRLAAPREMITNTPSSETLH